MNPERFARNLAAFEEHQPAVHQLLSRIEIPESTLVGTREDRDINIDLGHTLFYQGDAQAFAAGQMERFRTKPGRFHMASPPRFPDAVQIHQRIANGLNQFIDERGLSPLPVGLPTKDSEDCGYLIVYGLGLGFHLEELIREVKFRQLIVVEEFPEFLYHSLHLHDWAGWLEELKASGRILRMFFGSDVSVVAAQVHWYLKGSGFGLLDGSYVFRHYSSLLLDQCYEDFVEKLPLLPISIGFFEDEFKMMSNAGANLARYEFSYFDDRPRSEKDIPALILGSGPSIDAQWDKIRELKDKAVIFSAGTALGVLLRNGIKPDYQCELENVEATYEHLSDLAEKHDLSGITLLCSTTVDPRIPGLFGRRVMYFRDSVSSTGLWSPDRIGLYGTAPTVTNLGLRAAILFRFKEIFLFGVDLGTRNKEQHHSKDAVYLTDEKWRATYTKQIMEMSIELPGNFGGKAYTNQVLHWSRMLMATSLEIFSAGQIYNCSDGVRIPGTKPRLAKTVSFATAPGRKQIILDRMTREVVPKQAGEMIGLDTIRETRVTFADWYVQVLSELDRAVAERTSFIEFYDRMTPLLDPDSELPDQPAVRAVNVGTLMMGFQMGFFFYHRVVGADREAFVLEFYAVLRTAVTAMRDGIDPVFAGLIDQLQQVDAA